MKYLALIALSFLIGCAGAASPGSPTIIINKNVYVGSNECVTGHPAGYPCQVLSGITVTYQTESNTTTKADIEGTVEDLVDADIKLPLPGVP